MLIGHPFARRDFNPRDENGNEGCAVCGYPRARHAPEPAPATSRSTEQENRMASSAETHSMVRQPQQNPHLQNVRYRDRCGAQIEGPNAWGHDDHCPKKAASAD